MEKSILYNSASIFALIENVQYINFNFSGSTYHITREYFEEQYPNWDKIVNDGKINKANFNKYVEAKMNDIVFVEDVFEVFEKTE